MTAAQLVGELFGKTAGIKEALVLAFNPPPIFGLGTAGGFEFYIQNRGDGGAKRLYEVTQAFLAKRAAIRRFAYMQTLWRATVPQLYVDVDREKAKTLGVPISDIYAALSATLGNYYVNDFTKYGRAWQVLMSAEPDAPPASRRRRRGLRALGQGRDDSVVFARDGSLFVRTGRARPLQQPAGGQDPRHRVRRV